MLPKKHFSDMYFECKCMSVIHCNQVPAYSVVNTWLCMINVFQIDFWIILGAAELYHHVKIVSRSKTVCHTFKMWHIYIYIRIFLNTELRFWKLVIYSLIVRHAKSETITGILVLGLPFPSFPVLRKTGKWANPRWETLGSMLDYCFNHLP